MKYLFILLCSLCFAQNEEIKRIYEQARLAEEKLFNSLEDKALVIEGQEAQQRVIAELDLFIQKLEENTQKQPSNSSSSSSGDEQESTDRENNKDTELKEQEESSVSTIKQEAREQEAIKKSLKQSQETKLGQQWGRLPIKSREQIINEKTEQWPPEYEEQIKQFYKFLSE